MLMIKKIGIVCFTAVFIFSGVAVYAAGDSVWLRLSGLGIITADESEDYREQDALTRAEAVMIMMRLLRIDDAGGAETAFADVQPSHWASGAIVMAEHLGIVSGVGNELFDPEENVSFNQALKMLVCVLGYDIAASEMGGYPLGYVAQAGILGITRGVQIKEGAATRGDIARLVVNALDVVPLEQKMPGIYKIDPKGKTLGELMGEHKDTIKISGIVTETHVTSLTRTQPALKEGYVSIDGQKYIAGQEFLPYIGLYVEAYGAYDKRQDLYRITDVMPVNAKNTVITADARTVWQESGGVRYDTEDGKERRMSVSAEAVYIYNMRKTGAFTAFDCGEYTFVDNTGDGQADVIFAAEAESFLIERINEANTTVYFSNSRTYRGRTGIQLDFEDNEIIIELLDAQGGEFAFDRIEAGMGITLVSSLDRKYIKALVSSMRIEGEISEMSDNYAVINGSKYEFSYASGSYYGNDLSVGDSGSFVLDAYGHIIDVYGGALKGNYLYGYCIAAQPEKGLSGAMQLRVVRGAPPEKSVSGTSGKEVISYLFHNDSIEIYKCGAKIKLDGEMVRARDVGDISGDLVAIKLNAEGLVTEIYTYSTLNQTNVNYTFNADIISFGGESVRRGYATNQNTVFVCVPTFPKSDEDYFIALKVTDESTENKVCGVNFFPDYYDDAPNAQPVNVLMLYADMDASSVPLIEISDDVCIVGQISISMGSIRDDAGSAVYRIEMLNDNTVETFETRSSGVAFETAKILRKGDLIRYVKDAFGRIVNIQLIYSMQGLENNYKAEMVTGSGVEKGMHGIIHDAILDTYDYFTNRQVDKVTLSFAQDGGSSVLSNAMRLPRKDGCPVYLYNRATGWISTGSSDDIVTYLQAGGGAMKMFMLIYGNDVSAAVIIQD